MGSETQKKRMMKQINTVAVLGAGAIGAYVLYGLKDQYKDKMWVIAEGDRASRLKKEGLFINDEPCRLEVKTPEEACGVDLLIVSVKYGALKDILPMVRRMADSHTTVMSLLNGVDSEEILSEVVPEEQIIPALIRIASTHKGNRITFPLPQKNMGIIYGLPKAAVESGETDTRFERLAAVQNCFENSRLESHVSDDIKRISG